MRGDVGRTAWISCAGVLPGPARRPATRRTPLAHVHVGAVRARVRDPRARAGAGAHRHERAGRLPVGEALHDVFPDGTSSLVARNVLNLTHRDSREQPSAMPVGELVDVELEIEAASWTFEAGHALRLDLAGTDWPNTWSPPRPVTFTIDRAVTTLELPVIDGPSPIEERPVLPPPHRSDPARTMTTTRWPACAGRSPTTCSGASRRRTPAARSTRRPSTTCRDAQPLRRRRVGLDDRPGKASATARRRSRSDGRRLP